MTAQHLHQIQQDGEEFYTLEDVARAIERGVAYVSVNTKADIDSDNTGPGNYIMGEIRGQLNRDCDAKCTCGLVSPALNSAANGEQMTLAEANEDLMRGLE